MSKIFDLTGKVAVVTGASTGLGQGMSLGLAEAGADLLLVDVVSSSETEQAILKLGRKVFSIIADLSKMESVNLVVNIALEKFGKIDILVNNAGIIRRTPAIEFSKKD